MDKQAGVLKQNAKSVHKQDETDPTSFIAIIVKTSNKPILYFYISKIKHDEKLINISLNKVNFMEIPIYHKNPKNLPC